MTTRPRHAVPGGTSALKPPQRQPLAATPARPPAAAAEQELPPPPASRRGQPREQLNTKVRVELRARLDAFVRLHDSTLQGVLEAALDEYMTRRGWSEQDYQNR